MSSLGGGIPPSNPRDAIVAEWVAKAEADFELAQREHAFSGKRNLDMVGFLLQQAVEKLMKAVLIDRGITPPKTHDLDVLESLLGTVGVGPMVSFADLTRLTTAAVRARYPGASISAQEAADLLRIASSIRAALRPLV